MIRTRQCGALSKPAAAHGATVRKTHDTRTRLPHQQHCRSPRRPPEHPRPSQPSRRHRHGHRSRDHDEFSDINDHLNGKLATISMGFGRPVRDVVADDGFLEHPGRARRPTPSGLGLISSMHRASGRSRSFVLASLPALHLDCVGRPGFVAGRLAMAASVTAHVIWEGSDDGMGLLH
jgi:hypothetical protein